VQHAFEIPGWGAGQIRVSDLIVGEVAGGDVRPIAYVAPDASTIALRLVVRDASARFEGVTVRIELSSAADGAPIGGGAVPLQPTPDRLRRLSDVELGIAKYPRGEYLVTAIVHAGAQEIARRQRIFRR
jgi:hypothetical protein